MDPSSMKELDELEILRRAVSGDGEAFEEFLSRFGGTIREWIRRWVGSQGPVDDLTHEVFMRVFKQGHRAQPGGKVLVWLLRIARNLTVDYHRSVGVRKRYLEQRAQSPEQESTPSPLQLLEQQEFVEQVDIALRTLPEEMAATFILREREGLSYEEIAELLGTSSKTVSTRLHRVRQRLQGLLQPFLGDHHTRANVASRHAP